ncbi:MAG TPA: 3-deoxy-D-manno-octulosonic acid transferase [Gammaproteobacteria bacterium]|nr:3-deoxy-D-manno-octulosonic acid transferase [Gammaproteobacteria bacterium]
MRLLLDVGYFLGALVASPWILYRLVKTGGWRRLPRRFGAHLGSSTEGSIWLHGSSAGEVSLLRPLVERLERDLPGVPIVVSTNTSTGLAAASKAYSKHRVVLFPLDLTFVVRRFFRRLDPRLVVIVESELWPNFLLAASRRGVPVAVLNGKMSEKSRRAYARTRIVPRALANVALLAVQSTEHAERFLALGVPAGRVHVTGNMKYDLTADTGRGGERLEMRTQLGYAEDDVVVIGGSLHPGEPDALARAFLALERDCRAALIVVPRYPSDAADVEEALAKLGLRTVRKTALDRGEAGAPGRGAVLVVDTVGELGRLYSAADVAFVGGSLFFRGSNKGGHNLMEPAIRGVATLFGPYNFSFKETVKDLLRADAGVEVADAEQLRRSLRALVTDPRRRTALGERARQVVLRGRGATERNYTLLRPLLESGIGCLQPLPIERTMPRASGKPDS